MRAHVKRAARPMVHRFICIDALQPSKAPAWMVRGQTGSFWSGARPGQSISRAARWEGQGGQTHATGRVIYIARQHLSTGAVCPYCAPPRPAGSEPQKRPMAQRFVCDLLGVGLRVWASAACVHPQPRSNTEQQKATDGTKIARGLLKVFVCVCLVVEWRASR